MLSEFRASEFFGFTPLTPLGMGSRYLGCGQGRLWGADSDVQMAPQCEPRMLSCRGDCGCEFVPFVVSSAAHNSGNHLGTHARVQTSACGTSR